MHVASKQPVRSRGEIVNSIGELIKWLDGYGTRFRTANGRIFMIRKPVRKLIYTPYDWSIPDLEKVERLLSDVQEGVCLGLNTPIKLVCTPFQPSASVDDKRYWCTQCKNYHYKELSLQIRRSLLVTIPKKSGSSFYSLYTRSVALYTRSVGAARLLRSRTLSVHSILRRLVPPNPLRPTSYCTLQKPTCQAFCAIIFKLFLGVTL